MDHKRFVGRQEETKLLQSLLRKKVASFVVIRGRRRIGKSRLIQEFGSKHNLRLFVGLPPNPETTRQGQLEVFARQMAREFGMPQMTFQSWEEAFWQLGVLTRSGRVVLALDEISWMGSKDPQFLGYLKNAWDTVLSNNPKLILIVCGSVSSWIDRNILSHTGFLGRISFDIQLRELPLRDAMLFWESRKNRVDPYEILKVLSVTGGVPRYLEDILPEFSAEENIRRLCFQEAGLLFLEFDRIFSDLFYRRAERYTQIVECLADGSEDVAGIARCLQLKKGGKISAALKDLQLAGFVSRDVIWGLRSGKISQLAKYRLSDNYLRFYLKYIRPNRARIQQPNMRPLPLTSMSGWSAMMGLQFENLVLANRHELLELLGITDTDVLMSGPYFQRATQRKRGCQIDLLIQTRFRVLYLCEIKFSVDLLKANVIDELREKSERLTVPRGWSIRTVLIHVNGVSQSIVESSDVDHIIDFGELCGR